MIKFIKLLGGLVFYSVWMLALWFVGLASMLFDWDDPADWGQHPGN